MKALIGPRMTSALPWMLVLPIALGWVTAYSNRSPILLVTVLAAISVPVLFLISLQFLVSLTIVSLVLENSFVVDIGFTIRPTYVLISVALIRLISIRQLATPHTPLNLPVLLFGAIAVISIPVAIFLRPSFLLPEATLRYSAARPLIQASLVLLFIGLYFVILMMLQTIPLYLKCLKLLVVTGTVVSIYALYQQVAFRFGLPGITFAAGIRDTSTLQYRAGAIRAFRSSSTFLEPHSLGAFLILTGALTLALVRSKRNRIGSRNWLCMSLVLHVAALLSTLSTAAFLGFAATLISFILISRGRAASLAGLVLVSGLMFYGARSLPSADQTIDAARSRFQASTAIEQAPASGSPYVGVRRKEYREVSLVMLRRFPLTGVGIGNFGLNAAFQDGRLIYSAGSYGFFWGVAGELGLPGLIIALFLIYRFISSLIKLRFADKDSYPELSGFVAGFVGLMVQYLGGGYTRMDPFAWAFMGLAMAGWHLYSQPTQTTQTTRTME